ncbi:8-oxoguanine deaminase [Stackebrandtia nassauensis]|uniref:Amidohydrolase n=1 Tax=Stackebrandtia nassauensis (strain DSM 44728 / CIP 108903 / NRRL B-16338 / NBRC 102104 / LLR-40K-21) TaxID=446470 RepID=D3Q647_STANL|nr:8-oxoguanine deaminase [Stackebrandtia nassauensis]ADD42222.1 amidohydrolase [Stackebrandtia nassauensis DSM 44728]
MSSRLIIDNAAVATVDDTDTEHQRGHIVVEDGRITAVAAGSAPSFDDNTPTQYVDGAGCLATPGLVNTHHHLYQWVTRGMAVDHTLFQWLTELYPVWARLDADGLYAAVRGGLGWLALTGCTTSADHHYVYPRAVRSELDAAHIGAVRDIGLRFHAARGSMDRGESDGGLPPDHLVESIDEILSSTQDLIGKYHDPSFDSMLRVAVAPCSPFSVSSRLLRESAELARSANVRLHTHLCESLDEEEFCRETHGCSPVEYMDSLGWLGDDVWFAHAVHLSPEAVKRLGDTGTGAAHCPSSNARLGTGMAGVRAMLDARMPVGLGVDGAASQEASMLIDELRLSLYTARQLGGPTALSSRQALRLGTMGGAAVLGRQHEIGSLEPGKLADIALWRLDGLAHADIADPVAALTLGAPAPLKLLTVGGRPIVADGELLTADTAELAREARAANRRLVNGEAK